MKKILLICMSLVFLTGSALAFQVPNEPSDLPQSINSKMATPNRIDKVDVPNANIGEDHDPHIEEESKPSLRRKMAYRPLLK